jgi:HAE1 family hydrophobic/amphiphilic exporter-1
MFQRFIQRPVLAIVISLLLIFTGLLSMRSLPTSQFPEVAPPRVIVMLDFPGSNADTLVKSSLILLERAINGVPGMRYLVSDATSAGEATIQVMFDQGIDPNIATVNVKTRIDQVLSRLPPLVQLEGVRVMYVQPSMLMYVNLYSDDATVDEKFLYNFANVNIIPELQRITGIAQAQILGTRIYAMRIWLNPDRMRAYNVSAEEVMTSIDDQSLLGRPGRVGQSSGKYAQSLEYTLTYPAGRYNTPEQYGDIVVRSNPDGELLKLKDIAEIELGSEFFDVYSTLDGKPSAAIVLKQIYGSNAQQVIEAVKDKLGELKADTFPPQMDYQISYDVSKFLDASIEEVVRTLMEAFVLVALVVFVFLGDWRSTLIPTIAVPVSLIGAFVFMRAFGLTINLITLFALVLAIGVVVDDAIVVVEAVHAKMAEDHVGPFSAVKLVLDEIAGAVVAITLLMAAVFVPVAFMSGPVGIFYRQFSITMASAIILSGVVALTLTPVLSAIILRPHAHIAPGRRRGPIRVFLDGFEWVFAKVTDAYVAVLRRTVDKRTLTFGVLAAFVVGIVVVSGRIPSGFVPSEDQGMIYAIIQTPPGSTLEQTNAVARRLQGLAEEIPEIDAVSSLAGYEILTEGRGSNAGTCLIQLKDWAERDKTVTEVIEELEEKAKDIGAVVEFFEPPAVPGYGAAGGVSFRMLDRTNSDDYQAFDVLNKEFMDALAKRPELTGLFTFYAANYPQYELTIDPNLARQKGVSIRAAMENLDILVGSTYEQGFIRFGNYFKVYTQSAPEFRRLPTDILNMYVKNDRDEMVPYSAFMSMKPTVGPNEITRYNIYNSSAIRAVPAKGYTTGEAIGAILDVAHETLPRGFDVAWEGLSYDEAQRGNEALAIFGVVLAFVYLVLAAQYESFILPLAVITSLPAGIFGSFLMLQTMGLANDIYAQIGLVMLVGLLGKNAVLIVEFAVQRHQEGLSLVDAAIEGAKARFRPILMTSFAFVAGLVPLVFAHGPGAIANRTIGSSALGGMLFGTIFGVFVIPGLYVIFGGLAEGRQLIRDEAQTPLTEEGHHHG